MKQFIKKTLTALLAVCLLIQAAPIIPNALEAAGTVIDNLTVEYTENPVGLECETPRFGWQMNNYSERGLKQTAYCILHYSC